MARSQSKTCTVGNGQYLAIVCPERLLPLESLCVVLVTVESAQPLTSFASDQIHIYSVEAQGSLSASLDRNTSVSSVAH